MAKEERNDSTWSKYEKFVLAELGRIGDGFEGLRDGQNKINRHLETYNGELRLHIRGVQAVERRTEVLEDFLKEVRKEVAANQKLVEARLKVAELPITWARATGQIFKWVVYGAGAVGAGYTFARWMAWVS